MDDRVGNNKVLKGNEGICLVASCRRAPLGHPPLLQSQGYQGGGLNRCKVALFLS